MAQRCDRPEHSIPAFDQNHNHIAAFVSRPRRQQIPITPFRYACVGRGCIRAWSFYVISNADDRRVDSATLRNRPFTRNRTGMITASMDHTTRLTCARAIKPDRSPRRCHRITPSPIYAISNPGDQRADSATLHNRHGTRYRTRMNAAPIPPRHVTVVVRETEPE